MGDAYNLEMVKRLKNNHYAIDKSFERLKKSIEIIAEQDVYSEIGNLLLWVLTTDEWHKKNETPAYNKRKFSDSEGCLLTGLRYAYNLIKHNMEFILLHKEDVEPLFSFPFEGEFQFGLIKVVWANSKGFKDFETQEKVHENQKKALEKQKKVYSKHIEGKNVIDIFEKVINFLNKEKLRY